MNVIAYSNKKEDYLKVTEVVNYDNETIQKLAEGLFQKADNEVAFIKLVYEFVRDQISHSADIGEDLITCSASEVLAAGHGICFAKSNLLAAILRCKGIPTGFCYQKLILDDDISPVLIYHGLNGVYIKEINRWVRLDARGNKEGVNAQFSLDEEQLAFPIRAEKGEEDDFMVYPNPDANVIASMKACKTRSELWEKLPTDLMYKVRRNVMLSKKIACVGQSQCVACGACLRECLKRAISIHKGCYATVDPFVCVGCGKCAKICPANAISLSLREEA